MVVFGSDSLVTWFRNIIIGHSDNVTGFTPSLRENNPLGFG